MRLRSFLLGKFKISHADMGPVPKGSLLRLLRVAGPEKVLLASALGALAVGTAATLALPFTFGKLLDATTGDEEKKEKVGFTPREIAVGCMGLFVVGAAATFGQTAMLRVAGERMVKRTRVRLFSSLMRQPISWIDSNKTGELVSRLSTDTQLMSNAISENMSLGVRKVVEGAGALGLLLWVSPNLTATMVAVLPFFFGSSYFGRWVKRQTEMQLNRLSDSTHVAEERLQGLRTIRAFSREEHEEGVYKSKISEVYDTAVRLAFGSAAVYGGTSLILNSAFLAVLFRGTLLVESGAMSVGDLTSFLLYTGYLGMSFNGILKSYTELMRGVGASTRVLDLIDKPAAVPLRPPVVSNVPFKGDIELQNVHFAYPDRPDAPVLQGLSLKLQAGKSLALVGHSGSGKTTVLSLLMKFFDPTSGSVLVGGQPIQAVDHHWWMSRIGFVSQDVTLFSGTIMENLRMAKPDATEEEIKEACRLANAAQFIEMLPEGYDTVVGARGASLSGGQRQRISIARSLLKNPDLLLLDEPTSALDFKSENLVREGLKRAMEGRTCIIVAHRLSTIKYVDTIAVVKRGIVVDSGTHDELMSRTGGFYRKLVLSHEFKNDAMKPTP